MHWVWGHSIQLQVNSSSVSCSVRHFFLYFFPSLSLSLSLSLVHSFSSHNRQSCYCCCPKRITFELNTERFTAYKSFYCFALLLLVGCHGSKKKTLSQHRCDLSNQ